MATKTAVGGANDDFGRILRVLAVLGTAASLLLWARRWLG